MSQTLAPLPYDDEVVWPVAKGPFGKLSGTITPVWQQALNSRDTRIDQSAAFLGSAIALTSQSASIVTTPIPLPTLAAGTYQVSVYGRVTTAGGATSTLTITISFTDGAVACAFSTTALTSNTTASVVSQTFTFDCDQATPISYATVYGSTGIPAMLYKLSVSVAALPSA